MQENHPVHIYCDLPTSSQKLTESFISFLSELANADTKSHIRTDNINQSHPVELLEIKQDSPQKYEAIITLHSDITQELSSQFLMLFVTDDSHIISINVTYSYEDEYNIRLRFKMNKQTTVYMDVDVISA